MSPFFTGLARNFGGFAYGVSSSSAGAPDPPAISVAPGGSASGTKLEPGDYPYTVPGSKDLLVTGDTPITIRVKVRGNNGVSQADVTMEPDTTFYAYNGSTWAGLFYGPNTSSRPVCVMMAGEKGNPSGGYGGGNANYPKGNNGGGDAMGGRGGQTTGYLTGTGGDGGSKGGDLPGNPGNPGGAFSYGNGGNGTDGNGQRGGFGYYGGGGGGGVWDQGESNNPGGAGGGGSNYIGGLPGTAPAPVPVANTSSGNEPGGALIQLVSIVT